MNTHIERLLAIASKRALYPEEINRLRTSIRALQSLQQPPEDVLVRRIKELEQSLKDCRARVRKCERNGLPD